ncbi:type VI secretion system Vgr family protein [Pseudoduganella buxea]|uniref:Type VI secretion system tip protein VgrG n=1 Tax=Pseudoduganella buxea TaxID=1949069 RepID=A0A6I3T0H9_9BURK|nr:type VI secretion system tip protein TssI/VgrG [Pseudoduganella buxea]MTV55078.1 type VI secretion system tip protein VgrG [Pseudoduganella buxea]GGC13837.1 hypothetical protein GCM10011572_39060 [Pseudoduganella buxea]
MLHVPDSLTQTTRLLRLTTPVVADGLVVECLRGEEAIGQCYALDVTVLSHDAAIPLKSLLGQPALLELDTTGPAPRMFHGHITEAAIVGADGGLARYRLTLGPWFAFLRHGRDSRVFQGKSVPDILSALFSGWQGAGTLVPAWRFDLADAAAYPVRSLACQYQESDFAFAQRLMSEEGLFWYFEHAGEPGSASLGSHTLVIADHNGSFQPNAQPAVRFTQPGAVMREDSIDRWRAETRWTPDAIALSSWDYRGNRNRPVGAAAAIQGDLPLTSRDTPGAYAYPSREQGQRIADRQMQALETRRETWTGAGTVRTLVPGTTFTLAGQAQLDSAADDAARSFVVTRVLHLAHNNLSADIRERVLGTLGESALAVAIGQEGARGLHAVGHGKGERPLYRNRIDAVRSAVPYRSSSVDGHGQLLHPKPTVRGQQTAIVVGPPGAAVHTDRDHRIKVQFHWQRGVQSHSRLEHPAAASDTGAPGDDGAGTWVRLATPLAPVAGANWGSAAVPRVGSEVLIDFIDGNIDRPVVIGAVYNGRGQADAQHNQVAQGAGVATGNAAAWFPGEAGAHAHAAVLSGLKSQAMNASQQGTGGYSQLVFDDSPGQPRVALQRHAKAHDGTDELNLGHLVHQSDNQRLAPAGFGAELKSAHGAALRAGGGLLLSADARHGGSGQQLDSREALAQVGQSRQLQQDLAETAQKHNAGLKGAGGAAEAAPDQLPVIAGLAKVEKALDGQQGGSGGDTGGQGNASAYGAPQLQLSSPAGIAATTPASAILRAGTTTSIAAGQDVNLAAQGNSVHTVKEGISLFTYGKASAAEKPNQETGLRLHAASGQVSLQSQSDVLRVTADKAITVASVAKSVTVAAKEHVMLTAQGAYLKLEGGNIMLHGPGTMTFKASMKELAGPARGNPVAIDIPKPGDIRITPLLEKLSTKVVIDRPLQDMISATLGGAIPYRFIDRDGQVVGKGTLDEYGRTRRIFHDNPAALTVLVGEKRDWTVIQHAHEEGCGCGSHEDADDDGDEDHDHDHDHDHGSDDDHGSDHEYAEGQADADDAQASHEDEAEEGHGQGASEPDMFDLLKNHFLERLVFGDADVLRAIEDGED